MSGLGKRIVDAGGIGNYSSAVVAGGFCFVSGQAALDESGVKLDGGIAFQTETTIASLERVLRTAGYALADVVKVTCYLSDLEDWSEMDAVFGRLFAVAPPARATVQATLIYGCLVEMDCIAWHPPPTDG